MMWPKPEPGLVVRYSYLWHREALAGREEGVKDRPCLVLVAVMDAEDRVRVFAVPITHARPSNLDEVVSIPPAVKRRLNLDGGESWIVVSEANVFVWPGPDLRPVAGSESGSVVYGFLPPALFRVVRDRVVALDRMRKAAFVTRIE